MNKFAGIEYEKYEKLGYDKYDLKRFEKESNKIEWDTETEQERLKWILENANKERIISMLESKGYKLCGASEISGSNYYSKNIDGEDYIVRISDHLDRHPKNNQISINYTDENKPVDFNINIEHTLAEVISQIR